MKTVLSATMPTKEKAQALAKVMCFFVGIQPEDPLDGSANWFMFYNEAEKIILDLEKRFPRPMTEEAVLAAAYSDPENPPLTPEQLAGFKQVGIRGYTSDKPRTPTTSKKLEKK